MRGKLGVGMVKLWAMNSCRKEMSPEKQGDYHKLSNFYETDIFRLSWTLSANMKLQWLLYLLFNKVQQTNVIIKQREDKTTSFKRFPIIYWES